MELRKTQIMKQFTRRSRLSNTNFRLFFNNMLSQNSCHLTLQILFKKSTYNLVHCLIRVAGYQSKKYEPIVNEMHKLVVGICYRNIF